MRIQAIQTKSLSPDFSKKYSNKITGAKNQIQPK